jgi:mycothiol synthase
MISRAQALPAGAGRRVAGLTFRSYAGPADIPVITAIQRAANLFDDTEEVPTEERIANEFAHADGFEPATDSFVAELDGRAVAEGDVRYILRDGAHTYELLGAVHPEARGRGVGTALLALLEARAAERAATLPAGEAVWLDTWSPDTNTSFVALMERTGYEPIRHFFEMLKRDLATTGEMALPAGLELRPVVDRDMRRIFDAEAEAFQDHWGHREWTDQIFAERLADPDLDTSLWRVAWDGDEVAGVVTTFVFAEENATLGLSRAWLEHVSVRRPWRRRGLAAALILSACVGLHERGIAEAALGVDSANLTGALGLYENLGFVVARRATSYRRALRG